MKEIVVVEGLLKIKQAIALISLNETLFIQILLFLVFLYIINRVMIQPLLQVMTERDEYMVDLEQETIDDEKEMERLILELNDREDAARDDALLLKKNLEDEGNRDALELLSLTNKKIIEYKDKIMKEVDSQIVEARKSFDKESKVIANVITEKILDRRLSS